MLPKQDYKVQKKDYIPLLSNCDNLIEEYAREMLGSVGQGMKHMIGRYTSLPSLSLKIKEFLNVLLHPRKYTSEIWDDQLLKNSINVKSELDRIKIQMLAYSHQYRIDELDNLAKTNHQLSSQLDYIRSKFTGSELTNRLDILFKNTMGVNSVKNHFDSTVSQIHLFRDGMYLDIYNFINFIDNHTAQEIVQNIKSGGAGSFLSNSLVKFGSGLDSYVVLTTYSLILSKISAGIYNFFHNRPIFNDPIALDVIQNTPTPQPQVSPPIVDAKIIQNIPIPQPQVSPPVIDTDVIQNTPIHQPLIDQSSHHNYGELAGGLALGLSGYALYKYLKSRKESGF